MRILMLGWEFPPFFAGGVGVVCSELSKALARRGEEIIFVMPSGPLQPTAGTKHLNKFLIADKDFNEFTEIHESVAKSIKLNITIKTIESLLNPYITFDEYQKKYSAVKRFMGKEMGFMGEEGGELYGKNLIEEVYRFAIRAISIGEKENFDVIHAHDWTTFPAGIVLKKLTGKPLVVHIHITEFDKSGGQHANPEIYKIEREGMVEADTVIAVSNAVKERCIHNYYIDGGKIVVIHNASTPMVSTEHARKADVEGRPKIVLFAGRVTLQKGPDYFIEAARLVLQKNKNVLFVMAGTGDMLNRMIEKAADYGMADKFIFTGFYDRKDAERLFGMADVFVMPSVSEPFGITPLEAQYKKVPTIISRQTGVSEILKHCLKVNFWDINALAGKILEVLAYAPLKEELKEKGFQEVQLITWDRPAMECIKIYNKYYKPADKTDKKTKTKKSKKA
ncbi:MAG: glycosyltransferase family 4 protein [bacterium]|nr:glycosyltransferase family 4 protein [bacterium]